MKILRVISSVNPAAGGPINGLVNSSNELLKLGHEIDVLSLDDPTSVWIKNFNFTLHTFSSSLGGLKYSHEFSQWLNINVSNYDVVIIHGLWQYHSYASAKACVKYKIPYVTFTHGMLDPWFNQNNKLKTLKKVVYWKLFEQFTINKASAVLFTSEEEKNLARQSFSPYSPIEKVVAYGCPLYAGDKFSLSDKFYSVFPHLKDSQFGLFLSRIHTKKGIDLLIDALAQLSDLPSEFKLAIAGPDSGGLSNTLKAQVTKLGLDDKIIWLGMLDGEVKWGAYHAADFFILPSHQENFGIVVAEALSTATPVLITNKVNIWREINSSESGFVAEDDVIGITTLLKRWFSLTEERKLQMSDNAKNCYTDNFSIKSAALGLDSALNEVFRTFNGKT